MNSELHLPEKRMLHAENHNIIHTAGIVRGSKNGNYQRQTWQALQV